MKQSLLFTKTSKEAPSDEQAKNAQLLIRAGFVYKVMAGVYAYTPLGLRVLENIKRVVREEMNDIDGQELIMTNLQPKEVWETTSRWNDEVVDVWFKTKLKDGTEIGLAWSHEEAIMEMMRGFVKSYKDLPVSVYQFQVKLRNELRAKSGIMRGREFIMKDMYSLHATIEDLNAYYEKVKQAYLRVYERLGLGDDTYVTFASGGAFTKFSHEFQTVCEAGEDVLYIHRGKNIAVNEEVLDDAVKELGINKDELEKVKSAEVGNIFNFGSEKSEQMGINFVAEDGKEYPIFLASYGIGITRVMGVIVEKYSDAKGLVWSKEVAPFPVHLITLSGKTPAEDKEIKQTAERIVHELGEAGAEVLWDDREGVTAGVKFADADLYGIPLRIVLSPRTLAELSVEWKERTQETAMVTPIEGLKDKVAEWLTK